MWLANVRCSKENKLFRHVVSRVWEVFGTREKHQACRSHIGIMRMEIMRMEIQCTEALLHIEPLGPTFCGEKSEKVSMNIGCLPHEKKTQVAQQLPPLR